MSQEGDIDSDLIKVPILMDTTRQEMYAKYKEDPVLWTIKTLANHYNCSTERCRAVLFLMRSREEMLVEKGLDQIKPEWELLTNKWTEDPVVNTHEALAEQFEYTVEEVKSVLAKMLEHRIRFVLKICLPYLS